MKRIEGLALAAVLAVAAGNAAGQEYQAPFEAPVFAGSAPGTPLTNGLGGGGQDGWYNPVFGSADYAVFTYAGNSYAFTPPPPGSGAGSQFIAGRSLGGSGPARAQHDLQFDPTGVHASWDMNVKYDGVLPAAPNLGSFSLQPMPGSRAWQTLFNWVNVSTAAAWQCRFVVYDSAGNEFEPPLGVLPGPGWTGLTPGAWYRVDVGWSTYQNRITEISLRNLSTGAEAVHEPDGWYLAGGASPGALPPATAARLFTGGAAGNIVAWDNLSVQHGAGCYSDCNGDGSVTIADFACFQARWVAQDPYGDCNNSGTFTIADFGCYQTQFVSCG